MAVNACDTSNVTKVYFIELDTFICHEDTENTYRLTDRPTDRQIDTYTLINLLNDH